MDDSKICTEKLYTRNNKRMRREARHLSLCVSIFFVKKMTMSPAEKEKKGLILLI